MESTLKCKHCGKPFPTGQNWCNWCEPAPIGNRGEGGVTKPEQPVGASSEENGVVVTVVGSLFMFLLKGFCILIGLVLIAGGGLLSLCGTLGGSGGWIGVLLGILPLALGGYVVVLVLGKPELGQNEVPKNVETTIANSRQVDEK